jgi:hypothetical protein
MTTVTTVVQSGRIETEQPDGEQEKWNLSTQGMAFVHNCIVNLKFYLQPHRCSTGDGHRVCNALAAYESGAGLYLVGHTSQYNYQYFGTPLRGQYSSSLVPRCAHVAQRAECSHSHDLEDPELVPVGNIPISRAASVPDLSSATGVANITE